MKHEITIKPIAYINNDFSQKFGIPRQSNRCKDNISTIVFEEEFREENALREIDGFSHLWLIFGFSENFGKKWSPTVRPPRLGGNKRVGVFASRSPFRPNSLGLSSVALMGKEKTENGIILKVKGADLLDGTPIYDIKPYLSFTDSHPEAKNGYADEFTDYRLDVEFSDNALKCIPEETVGILKEFLSEDPRPSYQNEPDRIYSMAYSSFDVKFKVENGVLTVISAEKIK